MYPAIRTLSTIVFNDNFPRKSHKRAVHEIAIIKTINEMLGIISSKSIPCGL